MQGQRASDADEVTEQGTEIEGRSSECPLMGNRADVRHVARIDSANRNSSQKMRAARDTPQPIQAVEGSGP